MLTMSRLAGVPAVPVRGPDQWWGQRAGGGAAPRAPVLAGDRRRGPARGPVVVEPIARGGAVVRVRREGHRQGDEEGGKSRSDRDAPDRGRSHGLKSRGVGRIDAGRHPGPAHPNGVAWSTPQVEAVSAPGPDPSGRTALPPPPNAPPRQAPARGYVRQARPSNQ